MTRKQKIIIFIFIISFIFLPFLSQAVSLKDPLGGRYGSDPEDIATLIGDVARIIIGTVGSFALIMFIYGGFMMLISAGNEKKIEEGKKILTWSVIGILAILSSYLVLSLVINALTGQPL